MEIPHACFYLPDDGTFPNSHLPALLYRSAFSLPVAGAAAHIEEKFKSHGWTNSWRNGVYDFHHYHSNTHEVLGIFRGQATLLLGGKKGIEVTVQRGDVLIIPAGVAHKKLDSTAIFKCVGAYPQGIIWDMNYGKKEERPWKDQNIEKVSLPKADPVFGAKGLLLHYWKKKQRS